MIKPYGSTSDRSDRTAGDRLRHREKVREAIRGNIADIIAEESIIGKNRDKIIKVPIRGVKEYRFVYGDNAPDVGEGAGDEAQAGQVIGKGKEGGKDGPAGDRPGVDYYETDINLDELIEIIFEDLELPHLERKKLRQIETQTERKREGYRKAGPKNRLDKMRSVKNKIARQVKMHLKKEVEVLSEEDYKDLLKKLPYVGRYYSKEEDGKYYLRVPFHKDDLTYKHIKIKTRKESNAVVFCIMDSSGSMDTIKKYLARSFFFLLYSFLTTKYNNVEIVFIAHHTEAREVTEEEFFHKGESGGTFISSGYLKALEIIGERYHPALWNLYVFHCSDGDNFESDNPRALEAAKEIVKVANLFGYGEIKPLGAGYYGQSMIQFFSQIQEENFHIVQIQRKEDVWPSFKNFMEKDKAKRGN